MIEIIDANDSRAVRNKNNVLAFYDLMINAKKSEEGTAKFVSPAYIQHNPLIADGSIALGKFFAQITRERRRRHLQDGRRRQGNRTLGHLADRWRPEKLGTDDRAEHSARQPERNVLSERIRHERSSVIGGQCGRRPAMSELFRTTD
jgi:hypothetical protein